MDALIIAAGQGARLKTLGPSKPLVPLSGKPLIQHVIERAHQGGIERFFVVTGYRSRKVAGSLETISRKTGLGICSVYNADWKGGNGLSVLAAKGLFGKRFLLTMSDHLFDPELVENMISQPAEPGELILAVDRRLDNPLVDLDDVTRVETQEGGIVNIGKNLVCYDCFDTGVFSVDPLFFNTLETVAARGDESLSDGVRELANRGLARVQDIGERFWIDVDDKKMFLKAQAVLNV